MHRWALCINHPVNIRVYVKRLEVVESGRKIVWFLTSSIVLMSILKAFRPFIGLVSYKQMSHKRKVSLKRYQTVRFSAHFFYTKVIIHFQYRYESALKKWVEKTEYIYKVSYLVHEITCYKLSQNPGSVFLWPLDVCKLSAYIIHLIMFLITGYLN